MLSLGLKNAILVLLIILILHVLIKNAIADKKVKDTGKKEGYQNSPLSRADLKDLNNQNNFDVASLDVNKVKTIKAPSCPAKEENKDDDTELLKYVYGDDKDASDISQYFKGMDITKDVQKEIDAKTSCKAIVKDESLPLSTSCDPQFQSLNTDTLSKHVKHNCNLKQNISNMMLVEYEGENAMNGGELYGDLSAFDGFGLNYEEYECQKNI